MTNKRFKEIFFISLATSAAIWLVINSGMLDETEGVMKRLPMIFSFISYSICFTILTANEIR